MALVVILTPNPAIDVTYRVDDQAIGETNRVREVLRRPGGKGVNVARVLALLGHETLSLLPLGGSAGDWVLREMKAVGLETAVAPISEETRTTVAVVGGGKHPTLYAEPGPLISRTEADDLLRRIREACVGATILVIAGSLSPGLNDDDIARWIEAAHAAGALALIDAGGRPLAAAARAGADFLKPNESELGEATSAPDVLAGAELLLAAGAGTVVVTRGERGLLALSAEGHHCVDAIPGITGNATGAGDAATAGIVSAVLEHLGLDAALARAAALGAAAVLSPVAGEIDLEAYHRFIEQQEVAP